MDERLRSLIRRWEETGSLDAEAAYLQARMRLGELDEARVVQAAQWDHPAARHALGGQHQPRDTWPQQVEDCLHEHLQTRAALAVLEAALETVPDPGGLEEIVRHKPELEDLVVSPTPEKCQELADMRLGRIYGWLSFGGHTIWRLFDHAIKLALLDQGLESEGRLDDFRWIELSEFGDATHLTHTIRDELAPWLLGYSDPVATRVALHEKDRQE